MDFYPTGIHSFINRDVMSPSQVLGPPLTHQRHTSEKTNFLPQETYSLLWEANRNE